MIVWGNQWPVPPIAKCDKGRYLSYHAQKICWRSLLHLDIGKELLAGIFQACTEQIDHIVDNQETIVAMLAGVDCNWWVLLVVALHIELLLLG